MQEAQVWSLVGELRRRVTWPENQEKEVHPVVSGSH